MLTLKERHRVLAFLRCCSILCQLPIRVDEQSWKIRAGTNARWSGWVCTGSYALFVAHVLYKTFRLLHTLCFSMGDTPLRQIMLHFDVVSATVMVVYWYYLMYIKYADMNPRIVEMTLAGTVINGRKF